MNEYTIRVANAIIVKQATNEWSALKDTGLFSNIGNMIDYVRTSEPETRNGAWLYEVELNGTITIAYVKRTK